MMINMIRNQQHVPSKTPAFAIVFASILSLAILLFSSLAFAQSPSANSGSKPAAQQPSTTPTPAQTSPKVLINTNMGEIVIELASEKAPISSENFLRYVDAGFYNNTSFHRVIKGFMVQGGGFDLDLRKKSTQKSIKNEAKSGLKNIRGSVAMARTMVVDSATSQFFINLSDNNFLDHGVRDFGYAVFGHVVKGMDVVERIGNSSTTVKNRMRDVPKNPIYIIEAKRI